MEIYTEGILGDGLQATLRNPLDCSMLSHSDNTVYAVCFAHPNCFTTSHTPIPLGDIGWMHRRS
jgi:hypothetical protein